MIDFTTTSALRTFELRVADGSVFVNPHSICDLSPYFEKVCLDESFSEAKKKSVVIEDVQVEELKIFLSYIFPDENFVYNKKIFDRNFSTLIFFAERFLFPSVKIDIEKYILEGTFTSDLYKPTALVNMLLDLKAYKYQDDIVERIAKKLADMNRTEVEVVISTLPTEEQEIVNDEVHKFVRYIVDISPHSAYSWDEYSMRKFF